MPANKQEVYDVVSAHLSVSVFSCQDLFALIDQHYPGTPHDSIIPSDYLYLNAVKNDPSNDGNRGHKITYPRFLERVGRNQYRSAGWDGLPAVAISAPILRSAVVV